MTSPTRVCVIDLGTNSFHALIVDVQVNGSFRLLDNIKELVQLGEGGLAKHQLSDAAIERGLDALRRIQLLATGWGVEDYLAFATSAIREASNGGAFIQLVSREIGIRIRTISGETEAMLIFEGVRRSVEMASSTLVVDIGGGSTELMLGTSDGFELGTSVKIGAARMTEEFVTTDPLSSSERKTLRRHYRTSTEKIIRAVKKADVLELVGSSGAFENLAQVCLNRKGELRNSIFQTVFTTDEFQEVLRDVIDSNRDERLQMSGIDARRVDQIAAAALLIDLILDDTNIESVRISPSALREGMVHHFVRENYERIELLAPYADVRRRSVVELAVRCQWEESHSKHVAWLALTLFDACSTLHKLDASARDLLEYAALLHDIGYHVNKKNHHKHSYYIIKNANLRGFFSEEIDIMATAARYHVGSLPRQRHELLDSMDSENSEITLKLAAILRLAEGLDRSHFQNVQNVDVRLTDSELLLMVRTHSDPELDLWGARRSASLFEQVFDVEVKIGLDQSGD